MFGVVSKSIVVVAVVESVVAVMAETPLTVVWIFVSVEESGSLVSVVAVVAISVFSMVGPEIAVVPAVVSNIVTKLSMVHVSPSEVVIVVAPVTVVLIAPVTIVVAPVSMVLITPVTIVGTVISVVRPAPVSMVVIVMAPVAIVFSMVGVVVSPSLVVLVTSDNSDVRVDIVVVVGWSMVVVMPVVEVIMMVPVVLPVAVVVSVVSPSVMIVVVAPVSVVLVVMEIVVLTVVRGIVVWRVWVDNSLSVFWLFLLCSWLGSWFFVLLFGWLFGLLSILSVDVSFTVEWDAVHLLSEENFGEGKTKGVSELIVVLIFPLSHGIHELMVHILSIDDEVMIDVEDEIPWVSESL